MTNRKNDLQAHLVNHGSARAGCAEGWRLAGVGVHQTERRTLLRLLGGPQKVGEYLLRQKKKRRGAVQIKRINQGIQVVLGRKGCLGVKMNRSFFFLSYTISSAASPLPARLPFPPQIAFARFTFISYNILSQTCLDDNKDLYDASPPEVLEWDHRKHNLLKEIMHFKADIISLQVSRSSFLFLRYILA